MNQNLRSTFSNFENSKYRDPNGEPKEIENCRIYGLFFDVEPKSEIDIFECRIFKMPGPEWRTEDY